MDGKREEVGYRDAALFANTYTNVLDQYEIYKKNHIKFVKTKPKFCSINFYARSHVLLPAVFPQSP